MGKSNIISDDTLSVYDDLDRSNLRADCENCFGFCCVALYFSASDGFPESKEAGKPCMNLQNDFHCRVHKDLKTLGFKGCTAFDCFGAGQKVACVTYGGHNWRQAPEAAKRMFEVFSVMRQIHEMLWYLMEALTLQQGSPLKDEIILMLNETEKLTLLSPDLLTGMNVPAHRARVNTLLLKTSQMVRDRFKSGRSISPIRKKTLGSGLDLIGARLGKADLKGENLRGAYLIAADLKGADLSGADLLGADLRDADIRGANLSDSIFLTQAQVNSAKGDGTARLPVSIIRPAHWQE